MNIGIANGYVVQLCNKWEILNKIIRKYIESQGFNLLISCELDNEKESGVKLHIILVDYDPLVTKNPDQAPGAVP